MIGDIDTNLQANEAGVLHSTRAFIRMSSSRNDAHRIPTTRSMQELRALLHQIESNDFIGFKSKIETYASKKCFDASLINGVLPGRNGKTLLHIAAAKGSQQMVQLLLKHGANPAVRDNQGRSCDNWVDGMPRTLHRLLVWQVSIP